MLRGFAVCGILLVNVPPLWRLTGYAVDGDSVVALPVREWLDLLVQGRFFPLFSLLFGIGFGLMLASARRRAARPRVVLLRRFVALGALGVVHQLLQPGEALLPYAVVAIAVLLPMTLLPARAQLPVAAVGGLALTVAGVALDGSIALVPGLFLAGFAIALADLPRRAQAHPRGVLVALAPTAVLAGLAVAWQLTEPDRQTAVGLAAPTAGVLLALVYALGLAALLRTPLRRALEWAFAPLGRMALTTYMSATLLALAARPLLGMLGLGGDDEATWTALLAFCAVVLVG